jgi:uncharacterized membrane protein (UPF0127 family)
MRILLIMTLLFSCTSAFAAENAPSFKKVRLGGVELVAEIADNDASRARGLMYRARLEPGSGMLFIFPEEGHYSFWMKNMRFALDMLWISSDGVITDILAQVPPCGEDSCPGLEPSGRARFVLEVESGFCAKHGLATGSRVEIER